MEQKEKDLLVKDLCARLPYNPVLKCTLKGIKGYTNITCKLDVEHLDELLYDGEFFIDIKPYLRPMSSMTKEELAIFNNFSQDDPERFDYLNSIHVDYRMLIPRGLAIAVTEENNPYKV